MWNSKDINRNRWRRHRLAYRNSACKRMEHDPSNRSGPTIFMNRYAHASSSSSSSSERASEHARIAGHVALHPPTASSRASSVVCTPRGALHHPLPCLALRVAPAFGVRGLRRALVARPPARRHQGDAAAPRYSLVIMHRGSGRLAATEALSGCSGGGGDPARTDVRDDAQQYAEQHSHGRGLGDGSASRSAHSLFSQLFVSVQSVTHRVLPHSAEGVNDTTVSAVPNVRVKRVCERVAD